MSSSTTTRGGIWVVGQFVILGVLLVLGAIDPNRQPGQFWLSVIATLLCVHSITVGTLAFKHLGRNLTAFPKPKHDGNLVTSGIYAYVRHPIYTALIGGSVAYALYQGSWWSGLGAIVLAVWLEFKARREEEFLRAMFADYPVYMRQVKKFIPFIY
jgi:protein-S-isoprenylcysteine O-methyltransferase Ste14